MYLIAEGFYINLITVMHQMASPTFTSFGHQLKFYYNYKTFCPRLIN